MDPTCEVKKKPKTFKDLITSMYFLRPFLGIVIGGVAGYLYYHYVGCASGSCAITGNPFMSTIAGGFLGFFALNSPSSRY
jgi:hypothetical protein